MVLYDHGFSIVVTKKKFFFNINIYIKRYLVEIKCKQEGQHFTSG